MKRTTIALEDDLLRQLKMRAAEEGRSLQDLVGDLLKHSLAEPLKEPYRLRLQCWEAREQPGVDILDRDKLYDLMDGL
jgi:plasmid stability protein